MRASGNLARGSVLALLRSFGRDSSSGALRLRSPEGKATIWFFEGRVVRASTDKAPRLGRLLVSRGCVDQKLIESALLIQKRSASPRRLGSILVGLSIVGSPRVCAAIATGIRSAVGSIADWTTGSYEFDPTTRATPDALFEGLEVEALVEQVEIR